MGLDLTKEEIKALREWIEEEHDIAELDFYLRELEECFENQNLRKALRKLGIDV